MAKFNSIIHRSWHARGFVTASSPDVPSEEDGDDAFRDEALSEAEQHALRDEMERERHSANINGANDFKPA